MNNTITILDWDSDFFETKIARIEGSICDTEAVSDICNQLNNQQVNLAYFSSPNPLAHDLHENCGFHVKMVDLKTTFVKTLNGMRAQAACIAPYQPGENDEKLKLLSVQSGKYSRFRVDEQVGLDKLQKLYETWMMNSVDKKMAHEVLVYKKQGELAGVVTLGEQNDRADIGILAVDEPYRGQGVGKQLLIAAENWFINHTNHTQLQVVTQGANTPACKLYEAAGFNIDTARYFYHWWRV